MKKKNPSVNFPAIFSNFSGGTFLDIKQPHLQHCLLEIHGKHGLVHGVGVDYTPSPSAGEQGLVGKQHPRLPLQRNVVGVIKCVSGGIQRLLGVVSGSTRLGQDLGKVGVHAGICVMSGVEVTQPGFER